MRLRLFAVAVVSVSTFAADPPIATGVSPTGYGAVGAGEGPVSDKVGNLYFTGGGRITKRDSSGKISVFREEAGGANGLIFDYEGRMIACESMNRRVVRTEKDGSTTVLTDQYESKKYNTPNDVTIDSKGRIYFSDPRYGNRDNMEMRDKDGGFLEGVYRIDGPGKVTRVIGHEVERANGVFVSAGDKYLYVADNNNNTVGGARKLWRFSLRPDGGIVAGSRKLIFDWKDGRGPDGMKMDREGRYMSRRAAMKPFPPLKPRNSKPEFMSSRLRANFSILFPYQRTKLRTAPSQDRTGELCLSPPVARCGAFQQKHRVLLHSRNADI